MSTASKGARLERHVINEWVAKKPHCREGIKSAASKTDIDLILIDWETGEIIFGQAKNWKRDLGERAIATILAPLAPLNRVFTGKTMFFGKEALRESHT